MLPDKDELFRSVFVLLFKLRLPLLFAWLEGDNFLRDDLIIGVPMPIKEKNNR